MRREIMATLVGVALFALGLLSGVALDGGLPIWQRQSVAPTHVSNGNDINEAHARLNTLLVGGWQVERVVPEHYGEIDEPTYILRKPVWS